MNRCPLCEREGVTLEGHHLETRRKDRDAVEEICVECHKTIHGLFTNAELRNPACNVDSISGLLSNERFTKALSFIKRVSVGTTMTMHQARTRRHKR
jgi:hypothetical protein